MLRLKNLRSTVLPTFTLTMGFTVTLGSVFPSLAVAPEWVNQHPVLTQIQQAQSLEDLYDIQAQIQEDVQQELQQMPRLTYARDMAAIDPYLTLAQLTYRLSEAISTEETTQSHYDRALDLAQQANQLRQSGDQSLATLQQEEFLWRSAIAKLTTVAADAMVAQAAADKKKQYEEILRPLAKKIDQQQSAFLAKIAGKLGPAEDVRIAITQLGTDEWRMYQGDVPPASPASLIKLPMAVVLMHKLTTENIDPQTQILVDPGNWTENAIGVGLEVGRKHSLRDIMARMISESNNTATNQLIDYLGRDYINQTLRDMGYPVTFVDFKLVGESTYPANAGSQPNRSTAYELTEMMRRVYSFENPGDDVILDTLVSQSDQEFGFQALQGAGPAVHWIGEKTGQNSKVIGSTVALKVGEERYVMTVTVDYSANQVRLRQVIRDVAEYILQNGSLDGTRQR
jgi:beta-lactamase class A